MYKIVELQENINATDVIRNIYKISDLARQLVQATEFIEYANKDDLNYVDTVLDKTRINLTKLYSIIKFMST